MVACELEDLPPRRSEYQFRFAGRKDRRTSEASSRAHIVTFVNAIFPENNVTFRVASMEYSHSAGATLVSSVCHGLSYYIIHGTYTTCLG